MTNADPECKHPYLHSILCTELSSALSRGLPPVVDIGGDEKPAKGHRPSLETPQTDAFA
jgi:hypothetical protein